MDFALTQEQRMVYEYGDRVSQRFDHKYWKAYAEKSEPPAELYKQITDDGFLGIMVPEAHGGLGLGLTEMAALMQELGKGLMADPLPAVALATRVLVHCPQWAGAGGHLAALARGEALPARAPAEHTGRPPCAARPGSCRSAGRTARGCAGRPASFAGTPPSPRASRRWPARPLRRWRAAAPAGHARRAR